MKDMLHAFYLLIFHGDYTPPLRPLLGEEDSPLTDLTLSLLAR